MSPSFPIVMAHTRNFRQIRCPMLRSAAASFAWLLDTRITIPTCRVHYPGGPDRCMCRLLPCRHGLPPSGVGSAFALTLSRPAQTSLALRPAGSLNRPRRPLSRGFDPASCPTESLVSYRINRQLSGWSLPPQVIRAVGAHTKIRHVPLHRRRPCVRSHARPEEPHNAIGP